MRLGYAITALSVWLLIGMLADISIWPVLSRFIFKDGAKRMASFNSFPGPGLKSGKIGKGR
jgi:hypothetical protein